MNPTNSGIIFGCESAFPKIYLEPFEDDSGKIIVTLLEEPTFYQVDTFRIAMKQIGFVVVEVPVIDGRNRPVFKHESETYLTFEVDPVPDLG